LKKSIDLLVYGLLGIVLVTAIQLVFSQWSKGGICPDILSIPACYMILLSVVLAMVAHAGLIKPVWFYVSTAIPWAIALIGTTLQFTGSVQCPQTESGIPMCFLSLGVFSVIIGLKIVSSKLVV
jgi:hypothetical protein